MTGHIPDCPQPETPIRERAWTTQQVLEAAETNVHQIPLRVRDMLRAYAAAIAQGAHREQEIPLSPPRTAEGQAIGVEAGAEAQPAEGGARAELTRVWVEPATIDSMRETDEFDGADGVACMVMKERDDQHRVPLYLHAGHPDRARLDWLERHPRLAEFVVDGRATDCYLYAVSGAPGLKLREIIDAAMRAEPSKPAGAEVRHGM